MQHEILEKHPEARLRVYAVWFNMYPGDARARWPEGLLDDPRVVQFWDADKVLGRYYKEQLKLEVYDEALWDAYLLYGPGASWDEAPPEPVSWGAPIVRSRQQLQRDLLDLWNKK